jgi:predicted phage terminase large subunit-like protein
VFLIAAWRKWLLLHGPDLARELGEPPEAYEIRQKESWGVCEWIAHSCKRFKVDRLLIEAKASGISIAQEMERLLFERQFGVELVNTGKSDKSVRANRVQHIFAAGMVYRPDRKWAEMVQDEMAAFPKARYDDLLDAMTQALWWLRNRRMLETKAEIKASNVVPTGIPRDHTPLYPM